MIGEQLRALNVTARYETITIGYTPPTKVRKYLTDYVLPNGIIIETKGRFVTADRQKHLAIKAQHPNLDVRFVFSSAKAKIAPQKTKDFIKWLWSQKGIKVKALTDALKARFTDEWHSTLKVKPSKTTYADWCDKHGFLYADKTVPPNWVTEPTNPKVVMALQSSIVKGQF